MHVSASQQDGRKTHRDAYSIDELRVLEAEGEKLALLIHELPLTDQRRQRNAEIRGPNMWLLRGISQ